MHVPYPVRVFSALRHAVRIGVQQARAGVCRYDLDVHAANIFGLLQAYRTHGASVLIEYAKPCSTLPLADIAPGEPHLLGEVQADTHAGGGCGFRRSTEDIGFAGSQEYFDDLVFRSALFV